MENKENYHNYTKLSPERFKLVRKLLEQINSGLITEEEALKQISKLDITNYSLQTQKSNYLI